MHGYTNIVTEVGHHAPGFYSAMFLDGSLEDMGIHTVAEMVRRTPERVVYHRLTGTAPPSSLLAPEWCTQKWAVLNALEKALARHSGCQGMAA